jgi:hypothetical protein
MTRERKPGADERSSSLRKSSRSSSREAPRTGKADRRGSLSKSAKKALVEADDYQSLRHSANKYRLANDPEVLKSSSRRRSSQALSCARWVRLYVFEGRRDRNRWRLDDDGLRS